MTSNMHISLYSLTWEQILCSFHSDITTSKTASHITTGWNFAFLWELWFFCFMEKLCFLSIYLPFLSKYIDIIYNCIVVTCKFFPRRKASHQTNTRTKIFSSRILYLNTYEGVPCSKNN